MNETKSIPGPERHPIWGVLPEFRRQGAFSYFSNLIKEYGDIATVRISGQNIITINNPDYIREVLIRQAKNFPKAPFGRAILGRFMGNGLVTNEGHSHKIQRKLAQPAFHAGRIQGYAETMVDYTEKLLDEWEDGSTRDVSEDMMKLTMWIVSKTLFDADVAAPSARIGDAVQVFQEISNHDFERGFPIPSWLPTRDNRMAKRESAFVSSVLQKIIDERRATAVDGKVEDRGDLLSMLMLAQYEDGSYMPDQQLLDEAITLFLAGHETTSNLLTWTWHLLSQHPDVEATLHEELDRVLGGRRPTMADLRNLPYTDMVLKESMRVLPPVWVLSSRIALEDTVIDGYPIKAGSIMFIMPYAMHHNPTYFPEPERFDPLRFTPENEAAMPKYTYFPFGAGARVCIGNSFAMMEAQLLLATMAQRFKLVTPAGAPKPKLLAQITLSPEGGLPMRLEARRQEINQPTLPTVAMAAATI